MKRNLSSLLLAALFAFSFSIGSFARNNVTTTYLTDADLKNLGGWTLDMGFGGNGYTDWKTNGDVPVIEFYHSWSGNAAGTSIGSTKTFNFSQKVTLPAGYYRLAVNAFYREGNGNGTNNKAYIYAGEKTQMVEGLTSAGVAAYSGSNDLYKAANAFSKGKYSNEFDFTIESETEIEIGFHGYIDTYCSWCILGPVTLYEYTAEDYMSDYTDKVTEATALYSTPMDAQILNDLKDAAGKQSSLVTVEDVLNAVTELNQAIKDANNSIAFYKEVKTYIDNAAKLSATGVASFNSSGIPDAYKNGTVTSIDDVRAAYSAAVLLQSEIGTDVTAAFGEITSNMTGWEYDAAGNGVVQVNTWSSEGDTDGSGMTTPFLEYWVVKGNILNENVIRYTFKGLIPNQYYSISALIRAYNEASTEKPSGAYLFAGTRSSADISTADPITITVNKNTSTLNFDSFVVSERANADGELEFGIVIKDNNFNWISIKNVKIVVSDGISDIKSQYNTLAAKAEALKSKPMASELLTKLTEAIVTPEETEEGYTEALDNLTEAYNKAKASVDEYAIVGKYMDKVDDLDDAGKASYTSDATYAEIYAAYSAGTLGEFTSDQKDALDAAFVTAVKLQTTKGSDMTAAIINPGFETGNITGWTVMQSTETGAKPTNVDNYKMSDSEGNYLFNTWPVGYSISQTIEELKPGKYTVTAVMASDADQILTLYVNKNVCERNSVDKGTGVAMSVTAVVTDGSLTISASTKSSYWYKVDNFRLTFVEGISFEDYYAQITELVDSADNLVGKQSAETSASLAAVVKTANAANGKERDITKLQTVIKDLKDALAASNASIADYVRGDEYNALNSGPGSILANEEADLEHWDFTYNGSETIGDWHVNTWSDEGDTDGTDIKTPFLEYWVAKGNELSNAAITHHKVAGLKAGYYRVSVQGRIYNESGLQPRGAAIFKVNGDYLNMISAGTQFDHKGMQGYYGTYEIILHLNEGDALSSSVTISGVNFNWISIKNYKVEYIGVKPTAITLNRKSVRIKQGDSVKLIPTAIPDDGAVDCTWASSDETVATVSDDGVVTAIKDGEVTITVTSIIDPTVSATAKVTVAYPAVPDNNTFDIASDFQNGNIGTSESPQSYDVKEWTGNGGSAWSASAVLGYGTEAQINGAAIPATDRNGKTGGALGVSVGWDGIVTYTQKVMLSAGTYVLSADAYNANPAATQANSKLAFITEAATYTSKRTSYPYGEWVKDKVSFTLTEQTIGEVQIGISAVSGGSDNNAKVFFDNVNIVSYDPLVLAKEEACEAIDELAPVGNNIFQYSQANIDAAVNEVNAAATIEAVNAVPMPAMTLPESGKAYQIGTADNKYITVTAEGVKLCRYAQPLYFEAAEGGYLLSNGSAYLAYAGGDEWTLAASGEGTVLVFVSVDGKYTIKGANGYLGTDDTNAGSNVYGNKPSTSWIIGEFVPVELDIEDALTIAPYETIVAETINIDVTVDSESTIAIINNGKVVADNVTLNFTIPNNRWSFVKFPCSVPVSAVKNTQENTQWKIYRYDAKARADGDFANTWVAASDVLSSGEGYIIQSRRGTEETSTLSITVTDKAEIDKIFANDDVNVALVANASTYAANAGWNLIGNPYVAYYDKKQMSYDAPITVWDAKNETYTSYGSDEDYALSPLQAFFIQTSENINVTFSKYGRQTTNVIPTYAPARARNGKSASCSAYNLYITDGIFTDRTRVVIASDASLDYEIGRDASKLMSSNADVPQIYSVDANAKYSINERPESDGSFRIGAYFGHDGEYTISVSGVSAPIVLEDRLTGESVVLGNGTDSYTFYAKSGSTDSRFVVYFSEEATGITSLASGNEVSGNVYTIQGVKVSKAAQHGIYIENGKKVMK